MRKSLVYSYLLCEKCQVFERRKKEKKSVCQCECEGRRNIVFEHSKEHPERPKSERGRDRVDRYLERLVKYLCVRKGNRHIIGNKSHKTTIKQKSMVQKLQMILSRAGHIPFEHNNKLHCLYKSFIIFSSSKWSSLGNKKHRLYFLFTLNFFLVRYYRQRNLIERIKNDVVTI